MKKALLARELVDDVIVNYIGFPAGDFGLRFSVGNLRIVSSAQR